MRTLYFDCFAGASGNMILGALIGLGVDQAALGGKLAQLNLPNVTLEVNEVNRSGINAKHVEVKVPHEHVHRHLSDIVGIIEASRLSNNVKDRAIAIFTRLAQAEAKIHGIDVNQIHFHEVGALDAIVDVVGSCIGFEMLGIAHFACSKINVGSGFVEMAHGKYPVPPPAVAELLKEAQIYSNEIEGELITPTGAAIISTLCDSYGPIPEVTPEITAYGAGTRVYQNFPNVLRLFVGESTVTKEKIGHPTSTDRLILIETNLDDIAPQILGYVMERAFDLGALDCWFTPIQMKKNRPATMVSILCADEKRAKLSKLLYSETTTLGIRIREVERECLPREFVRVKTVYGEVDVKIARFAGRITNAMPEYDQVRQLAVKHSVPLQTVRDEVMAELRRANRASVAEG
jgi:uncharacterized protein (TIGR00299 family) protein